MAVENFTKDPAWVSYIQGMLADGEQAVAIIAEQHRTIAVTTRRLILIENSGGWSVIANSQIAAIEVSKAGGDERFVKVHFGGGLSRTLGAPDDEQARYIAAAAAFG